MTAVHKLPKAEEDLLDIWCHIGCDNPCQADRYLDFEIAGDAAVVRSKLPDHPLEMKMRRNGDRWRIVGVRDDQLATDIARTIGQQLIDIAMNGLTKQAAETLGVGKLADLLRRAGELVK